MLKKITLGFLFVFVFSTILQAGAFKEKLKLYGDINIVSDYVWRGQLCDDDPSIQTGLYLNINGLAVSLWTSSPLDGDDSINYEEVDYNIEYSKGYNKLNFALGYIYYDFPNDGSAFATELYFKTKLGVMFEPEITYYYDLSNFDNNKNYVSIEGSYSISDILISGHYGLCSDNRGYDIGLSAAYEIKLKNSILTPSVSYSLPLGMLDVTQDDKLYAGLVLGFEL